MGNVHLSKIISHSKGFPFESSKQSSDIREHSTTTNSKKNLKTKTKKKSKINLKFGIDFDYSFACTDSIDVVFLVLIALLK